MSSAPERERLERVVAEDQREMLAALDEMESAALSSIDPRRRIAEAPATWLLVAAGIGLFAALLGHARRSS
jgi:hypothetical protein